jgi:hypothetical protein
MADSLVGKIMELSSARRNKLKLLAIVAAHKGVREALAGAGTGWSPDRGYVW